MTDRVYWYRLVGKVRVLCKAHEVNPGDERHCVDNTRVGPLYVSTVFTMLNLRAGGDGVPLLFETAIFDDDGGSCQTRCGTWDEAETMHPDAVVICEQQLARQAGPESILLRVAAAMAVKGGPSGALS